MATVFRRADSQIYTACVKLWNAKTGKWEWKNKSTGVTDESVANGIAATLERASRQAKEGVLNREKALTLVNSVLTLAGMDEVAPVPSLKNVAEEMIDEAEVTEGTLRKYNAHWDSLKEWAGPLAKRGVDAWEPDDVNRYYRHLKTIHSIGTANDHMGFVSRLFGRAVRLGYRPTNPVDAITLSATDAVEKHAFTRKQVAAIWKAMRNAKRRDWQMLTLLGWNTGHRIQDLMNVDPDKDVAESEEVGLTLTLRPIKKRRRGGRIVVLPIPRWLGLGLRRLGGFKSIYGGKNRSGKASAQFIEFMKLAGVDPQPIKRKKRVVHLLSFHSFRHSMSTRLNSAGVTADLARLVTDHDSPKVQRGYVHAEVAALRLALQKARRH
ncbi:MAG TPA: hypothetical protein VD994_07095 [Prosthecobacter sp.]|nr:hypothetical protein [Prosthecobacter sp.]